jgi:type IV pilus assembly protein PilX
MTRHAIFQRRAMPDKQRGAVLYVALIMLILLALIGIAGMQVSTMQERMSGNFMASNMAFQNAESKIREREADLIGGTAYDYEDCANPIDPTAWANGISDTTVSVIRTVNISVCTAQCSAKVGAEKELCNMYRTTAFSRDQLTVADSSSASAIDTIFIKP